LDAVTDKANVDETLTLVTESLSQFAVTVNNIRTRCAKASKQRADWLNSEMAFQVQKALDAHAFSQIVAASPPLATPERTRSQESGTRSGPCAAREQTPTY
jgi:hypothetical protein